MDIRKEYDNTLKELQKRIGDLSGEKISENDTKEILVARLLQALGWNIYDPAEVKREFKYKNHPDSADFALKLDNDAKILIEAKELNNPLDSPKDRSQAINYASNVGVNWSVLTNGNKYLFFNSNVKQDYEKKLFKEFSIEKMTDPEAKELYDILSRDSVVQNNIETVWQNEYYNKAILEALQNLFDKADKDLVNLVKKKLNPEIKIKKEDIIKLISLIKDNIDFQEMGLGGEKVDLPEIETFGEEWDKDSLKKYVLTLKRYNKNSTIAFLSILANLNDRNIVRKDLILKIGENISNPAFNGFGLSGLLAGITRNCDKIKKEQLINKSENRNEFSLKAKYKETIKDLVK
jgi:predicted type IV restriction endonuclease